MMPHNPNSDDTVSLREALHLEIVINQALVDLLIGKGIITRDELLGKIEEISNELTDHHRSSRKQEC